MKIVFLCNEYPPYAKAAGIGVFTHTIAHGLAGCGHEISVLGYGMNPGHWDDNGIKVTILPQSTAKKIAWFINRRRLFRWLKEQALAGQIDVIEIPEYQGLIPFRFPWCPVVVRMHTPFAAETRILRMLEKRTVGIHSKWIAVSNWMGEEAQRRYSVMPSKMAVIYNPVGRLGETKEKPVELPKKYVLYAGTVSDRKGAYVLAEAAKSFLASDPQLHLVYMGGILVENGRSADETIRQILGQDLSKRVHFTGSVHHDLIMMAMKAARVFAFPSKLESFGLVPAEAMSCGVPVVYSTQHAGPEVIEDGVTGLLADPFSAADVANKVMRLLNDPALAAKLAANGMKAANQRFSLEECIDKSVAFYESVSENKKGKLK